MVDAKAGLTDLDENCIKMSQHIKKNFAIVITKVDKINSEELNILIEKCSNTLKNYKYYSPFITLTSAK